MEAITQFQGEYHWLSNFAPSAVTLDGVYYPTVENAYQAAKTEDPDLRLVFRHGTPGMAKTAGKSLHLRDDWNKVKLKVMKGLVTQKFQLPYYREKLLATGTAHLEEGNNWKDPYWGVCNGVGTNHLGKILMKVRAELQKEMRAAGKMCK